ncbi:MAG: AAA family ATPase [Marinilabiliaceae bacterium]|nr:AAA family ATPase [Marinilabiliaceae bacterium]
MKVKERDYSSFSHEAQTSITSAIKMAVDMKHEFLTVEHLAYVLFKWNPDIVIPAKKFGKGIYRRILINLEHQVAMVDVNPDSSRLELEESSNYAFLMESLIAEKSDGERMPISSCGLLNTIMSLNPMQCVSTMLIEKTAGEDCNDFIISITEYNEKSEADELLGIMSNLVDIKNKLEKDIEKMQRESDDRVEVDDTHEGAGKENKSSEGVGVESFIRKIGIGKVTNGKIESIFELPINVTSQGGMPNISFDMASAPMEEDEESPMQDTHQMSKGKPKTYLRDKEVKAVFRVMLRKEKHNVFLVGEPGVGKSQMAYAIEEFLHSSYLAPQIFKDATMHTVDMAYIVTGAQFRNDLERRLSHLFEDFKEDETHHIFFLDDIYQVIHSQHPGGDSIDILLLLQPYMRMSNMHFIATMTYEEYNKISSASHIVNSYFQMVEIPEPSKEDTNVIVSNLIRSYSRYHKVAFSNQVIGLAIDLASKHIGSSFFPSKALDILDEAAALTVLEQDRYAISKPKVTEQTIRRIISIKTRRSEQAIDVAERSNINKYANLKSDLQKKIYGQDSALEEVVSSVLMGYAGLEDETKPLASLFFVGPTGVGKTEVAKVLAEQLDVPLIRFDMSEFSEKHTVAKLIGSPAGYIGYDEGGILVNAVRKSPSAVLLFDEIEKAHPDIYNILLQVMDYALLTDSKGVKASFRNTIIIFTSNAGAQYAHQASLGFGNRTTEGQAMMSEVKKIFKPEFINRLTRIVAFNNMDERMASLILEGRLSVLQTKVSQRNVTVDFTEEAKQWLLKKGFSAEYGAREMDRVINTHVKSVLSRELLFGVLSKKKAKGQFVVEDDNLVLR